ncbi:11660_t:CDS:10 [Diversispora eburnea]|uniref:11660_t:CDS:1 n=1 Tax=Diversispora eburnea TaxID=1213867 RepID=A0A9N9FVC5_9GLOM|nr:11660_t:CDS:10 [Diversispora eburnea]
MAQSSFVFGVSPEGWNESTQYRIYSGISGSVNRNIEPVGRFFLAHARRKLNNHSFDEDDRIQAEAAIKQEDEVIDLKDEEEETPELLSRDPKDWKEQDHYAVLGLSKYRWKATDDQIKQAHRRKVLKHHPDKKASSGNTNDDAFFKCIQKAYEILFDPVKRRQFDSVDEAIDDSPPSLKAKGDFFEIYGPVFEHINSPKSEVEAFYDFWYNFDSWRSFEYLDKEDADGSDNRDDKRYLERKNKTERAKHKKEDTQRLRKIIALSLDPRILKFKQEEKAAREAKKKQREDAVKASQEAAKKQQGEKKKKEALKKSMRNERKTIKTFVKNYNYFYPTNESPPADVIGKQLSELDLLFEKLTLEELQNVRNQVESAKDSNGVKQALITEVTRLINSTDITLNVIVPVKGSSTEKDNASKGENKKEPKERPWDVDEISLLIKAANKFPGGSLNSEFVADHSGKPPRSNEELIKKSKEVQKGANALDEDDVRKLQHQKKHTDTRIYEDPSMREATINYDDKLRTQTNVQTNVQTNMQTNVQTNAQTNAQNNSKTSSKQGKNKMKSKSLSQPIESRITEVSAVKVETSIKSTEANSINGSTSKASSSPSSSTSVTNVWTATQQAQLERALQMYPPSWKGDVDRWDKISSAVEGKTKKECKLRVKYLSEQVKAKKAAQSIEK